MRVGVGTMVAVLLPTSAAAACGSCGRADPAADADEAGRCMYDSCEADCRAAGLCYGSCAGGRCNCSDACDRDVATDDVGDGDGARPESSDEAGSTDAGDIETRPGGSPGVVCRKVPSPSEDVAFGFDGQDSLVAFSPRQGVVRNLHLFDYQRSTSRILEALEDVPAYAAYSRGATDTSLDLPRIAYGVDYYLESDPDRSIAELRILHLESGDRMTVSRAEDLREGGRARMHHVTLRYPWLAWMEYGADLEWPPPGVPPHGWSTYAMNLETGDRIWIEREFGIGGLKIDLLGTVAVGENGAIHEIDLVARRSVQVSSLPRGNDIWEPVITPDWIAWLDQRNRPECDSTSPCSTKIWGFDRRRRVEAPLVTSYGMHGPQLDGEGDWLAYTDQRDDPHPHVDDDRQQNIYALHLPTMTEIRVEDWPGWQVEPKVYRGVGEWRILFIDEVQYMPSLKDLWDCNLPDPPSAGGP